MNDIEGNVRKIAQAIRDYYIIEEKSARVADRIESYIGSKSWETAIDSENAYRIVSNINSIITSETDDMHFYVTQSGHHYQSGNSGIERYTPHFVSISSFEGLYDESVRYNWAKVFEQLQDPVVFDVRGCPGGSPELAYYLLCHLFPDGTPLIELQTRGKDPQVFRAASVLPFYTTYNQVRKYNGRVRILVSGATGSAAESFAYAVQHRGRGKLYGGKTVGAAHVTFTNAFGDLYLHLPYGRTCDPDTHEDWEGKGLTPDYGVGSREYIQLIYSEVTGYTFTPVDPAVK